MSALTLDREIQDLTGEIKRLEEQAQAARAEGDRLVSEAKARGVNAFTDDSLAADVMAAYEDADLKRNQLATLKARQAVAMRMHADFNPAPAASGVRASGIAALLASQPWYDRAAKAALGGGALGSFDDVQVTDRDSLVAGLRGRNASLFGGGMYASGADGVSLVPIDQRLYPPVEIPKRKVRLIDLITVGATDSDLVRYGKQTVRTDNAAATQVGSGATGYAYSQATYTWTTADATVRSVGQYAKAPRENLADLPALQTLIEQQLSYGILLEAERLIALGSGSGQEWSGIYTEAAGGGYTIDYDSTNDRRVVAIQKAITAVRLSLYEDPDAIVMHPNDYTKLISGESTSGGFLLANASLGIEQDMLWGVPVVVTLLATAGTPVVGNFKLGATMWVRAGASIRISDSNEDDFIKRLVTILGEFRAAFAVQRPHAFCTVTTFWPSA